MLKRHKFRRILEKGTTIVGFLAIACGALTVQQAFAEETISNVGKSGRTIISGEPYIPPEPGPEPKVIYGTDDRIDVYQETDSLRLQLAASTCGLLDASDLTDNGNGTYTLQTSAYRIAGYSACSGEPFADQPSAMWCSGFLVGDDIIATAGHCYSSSDLSGVRFVFGFEMLDATTPVTVVDESQVYQGIEILGYALTGDYDYSVIRVDRPVIAPGASPLQIRRTGTIPNDTLVGVIGHPSGLPLKIAFGGQTKVYNNSPTEYFIANLDTYGGNSGSPVFNQSTGVVEGILVRGAQDFLIGSNCFYSNQLSDSQAAEDVSKTTTFEQYIPEIDGTVSLNRDFYPCEGTVNIVVRDSSAPGPSISVTLTTEAGDVETVDLTGPTGNNEFEGAIALGASGAAVVTGDNLLQAVDSDTVTATYIFNSNPVDDTSVVDCVPPTITGVASFDILPESARIVFSTNEQAIGKVEMGTSCGAYTITGSGPLATGHSILVDGLTGNTLYFYRVLAEDKAGNEAVKYAAYSTCFWLKTTQYGPDSIFTDFADGTLSGWTSTVSTGSDQWQVISSTYATSSPYVASFQPTTGSNRDARLVSPPFTDGDGLLFYHTYSTEDFWDGCVLEISMNGGTTWQDLETHIVEGGYDGPIYSGADSPISGQNSWAGGAFGTMERVTVDLTSFVGEKRLAFRFVSDDLIQSNGWLVDDIQVYTVQDPDPPTPTTEMWMYY